MKLSGSTLYLESSDFMNMEMKIVEENDLL